MPDAVAYVDGSGMSTGGVAGVGYVVTVDGREHEGSLSIPRATNQQAELLAAAYLLDQLDPCDSVIVWSDSRYVVDGWGWLPGWIARGWRTTTGEVANPAHWRRLLVAAEKHARVEFRWCKGHAGTAQNERADVLAYEARLAAREAYEGMVIQ